MTHVYTRTKVIKPMLIKGVTRFEGFEICPAECLVNTQQELSRGRLDPLDPFIADGNVWDTEPKEVATLFHSINHEFVQEWGLLLRKMERGNPNSPPILATKEDRGNSGGRPEMMLAIKNEALRRRDSTYHNNNQKGA